jgi:hypothetical protein
LKAAATGVVALGFGITPAYADEHEGCDVNAENMPVSAKVKGSVTTIGFMVSARWGDGVLTLDDGEERKFHMVGAKALETGVAANDFEGEVYNLKNVDDFEGTYYGAATSITLGTLGKGEGISNNARCVIIKYRMKGTGLKVSGPAPGGIEVSFID